MSTFVTGPTESIPAIWPGGAGMVNVPVSGTVSFLHSPLYAMIDSGDAVLEQNETNNSIRSGADCEVAPTNPIQPALKWKRAWEGMIYRPTVVVNLTDDNNDGKIDQNDVPSVVISPKNDYPNYGKLIALRGDTGQVIFSVNNQTTDPIQPGSSVTAGDIDGDGIAEIIVETGGGYLAYEHTGTQKWDNKSKIASWNAANPTKYISVNLAMPSLADLDGDGIPEIVAGATVFNNDGSVRCSKSTLQTTGIGNFGVNWAASIVADLDMDGKQEIIAGNTVYNADCTVKWWRNDLTDGLTAVGNLNNDGFSGNHAVHERFSPAHFGRPRVSPGS